MNRLCIKQHAPILFLPPNDDSLNATFSGRWLKSTSPVAKPQIRHSLPLLTFNNLAIPHRGFPRALGVIENTGTTPMKPTQTKITRYAALSLSLFALAGLAAAQDQTPHPWRSVNEPPPADVDQGSAPDYQPEYQPNLNAWPDYAQNNPAQGPQSNYPPPPPNYQQGNYPPPQSANIPVQLTIRPGTYIQVRLNQWLSSDRNQQGDTFTASLEQPIVVDGIVVAQRGQTVTGRVTDAQKAGRVEGTSRLGIQLTDLTFVDGQQLPIQSQMISRAGGTSEGRDAAAIGTTTALGAIIGAGADWGRGAAIGAGAGAAAGIIGVLLTRGHPTVIYPESVLTFRIDQPVTIATVRAPQAFRLADNRDYGSSQPRLVSRPTAPPPSPAYAPYPYAYGYPYAPYTGFSLYVGPSYGYYRGRGGYGYYRRH